MLGVMLEMFVTSIGGDIRGEEAGAEGLAELPETSEVLISTGPETADAIDDAGYSPSTTEKRADRAMIDRAATDNAINNLRCDIIYPQDMIYYDNN